MVTTFHQWSRCSISNTAKFRLYTSVMVLTALDACEINRPNVQHLGHVPPAMYPEDISSIKVWPQQQWRVGAKDWNAYNLAWTSMPNFQVESHLIWYLLSDTHSAQSSFTAAQQQLLASWWGCWMQSAARDFNAKTSNQWRSQHQQSHHYKPFPLKSNTDQEYTYTLTVDGLEVTVRVVSCRHQVSIRLDAEPCQCIQSAGDRCKELKFAGSRPT